MTLDRDSQAMNFDLVKFLTCCATLLLLLLLPQRHLAAAPFGHTLRDSHSSRVMLSPRLIVHTDTVLGVQTYADIVSTHPDLYVHALTASRYRSRYNNRMYTSDDFDPIIIMHGE